MTRRIVLGFLAAALALRAQEEDPSRQLVSIKRIYVDRLTGGDTAAQMRDLIISSLHAAKLFIITENGERADAVLRGAAEDLVYTDTFQTSEGVNVRASIGSRTVSGGTRAGGLSAGAGDTESSNIHERKHEALATVRLVNKEGDVIWSTTQESTGAKFRGASADVADKITRALAADVEKLRKGR
jgi:hypothetical protein